MGADKKSVSGPAAWSRSRWPVIALAVLAAVSLALGLRNSQSAVGSTDFQYSATYLMLEGINPYRLYLVDHSRFLLSQGPNYLPLLYLLLTPIGMLNWPAAKLAWAAVNLTLALFLAWRIRGGLARAGTGTTAGTLAALVFLSSTAVRNTIGSGQHGLFVMAALVLALESRSSLVRAVALAFGIVKYSIGACFVALLAGRRDFVAVVGAGVVTVAAFVAFALLTATPLEPALLLDPVNAARQGIALPLPFQWINDAFGFNAVLVVALVTLGALLAWSWSHGRATGGAPPLAREAASPSLVLVATLACLLSGPHHIYDYCVLGLPFIFGNPFAMIGRVGQVSLGLVIAYAWNGIKLVDPFRSALLFNAGCLLLWSLLAIVLVDHLRHGRMAASGG